MDEQTLKDRIWQELKGIEYPGYDRDIVSFGLVQRVAVCDGIATVSLDMERIPSETQLEVVTSVQDTINPLAGLESLLPRPGIRSGRTSTTTNATASPTTIDCNKKTCRNCSYCFN